MNEIIIANNSLPQLCGCGLFAASESFIHTDRVPDFCVLIYVIDGCIYVTEGDTDYEVNAGELLILKNGVHHFGKKKIQKGPNVGVGNDLIALSSTLLGSIKSQSSDLKSNTTQILD